MLYSILDMKAHVFGPLVESRSDEEAIRSFLITIQNAPNTDLIGLYPQDFVLYRIGDFDKVTGRLTFDDSPIQLISGFECVQMLKGVDNTCSEVAVRSELHFVQNDVAEKSTEEEVNCVKD